MSRLTNQLTVTVAGLRGPGLSSDDVAIIEDAKLEATNAAASAAAAAASVSDIVDGFTGMGSDLGFDQPASVYQGW